MNHRGAVVRDLVEVRVQKVDLDPLHFVLGDQLPDGPIARRPQIGGADLAPRVQEGAYDVSPGAAGRAGHEDPITGDYLSLFGFPAHGMGMRMGIGVG